MLSYEDSYYGKALFKLAAKRMRNRGITKAISKCPDHPIAHIAKEEGIDLHFYGTESMH